jgi:hypothetical protein
MDLRPGVVIRIGLWISLTMPVYFGIFKLRSFALPRTGLYLVLPSDL